MVAICYSSFPAVAWLQLPYLVTRHPISVHRTWKSIYRTQGKKRSREIKNFTLTSKYNGHKSWMVRTLTNINIDRFLWPIIMDSKLFLNEILLTVKSCSLPLGQANWIHSLSSQQQTTGRPQIEHGHRWLPIEYYGIWKNLGKSKIPCRWLTINCGFSLPGLSKSWELQAQPRLRVHCQIMFVGQAASYEGVATMQYTYGQMFVSLQTIIKWCTCMAAVTYRDYRMPAFLVQRRPEAC